MSFSLDQVVPWGRSYDEYIAMFSLTGEDLQKRILGCGDGPASFNAELTRRGGCIVSVDPLYQFTANEIKSRIAATIDTIMEQTRKNHDNFVWKHIKDPDELEHVRKRAMDMFLVDFQKGSERYFPGMLPALPFADDAFELALCSHLLFLYSEQLSVDFHIRSMEELCRVAAEVRIFPLIELNMQRSRHIKNVVSALENKGVKCRIKKVAYEFQKGGNEMLVCTRK